MDQRKLSAYGPSLIVLVTAALVLWAGPTAVRQITFARTEAVIQQASHDLTDGENILEQINRSHRDIALKVAPSVVYVSTRQVAPEIQGRRVRSGTRLSSGSGWVYDANGHIVTNEHVIQGAERIQVQLHNGDLYEAQVLGTDPRTDIAVLRISTNLVHPAERGTTDEVHQGDRVFAFGSPFDFRFSMSQGIVSGVKRDAQLQDVRYQNFIQVDAAINPGNSGGPLTDIYGRVIGMNTAIATGRPASPNEGVFSGIGLAIPMEMIEHVVNQLIKKGEVSRGFIGVQLVNPDQEKESSRDLGFTGDGVEVKFVHPGGPADRAGIRARDVILSVDGQSVSTFRQIQSNISSRYPGETVVLQIWRFDPERGSGRTSTVSVTLDEMDPEQMLRPETTYFLDGFGLLGNLATATPERTGRLSVRFNRGVLVEQVNRGSAIEGVLDSGAIITHVFGEPVYNVDEFYARLERVLAAPPHTAVLDFVRPDGTTGSVELSP